MFFFTPNIIKKPYTYYKRTKMIDYTLNCIEQSMQRKINYFLFIKYNKSIYE